MMGQREPIASLHSTATEKMRPFAWKIHCLKLYRFATAVAQIDDTETSQFHLSETTVVCLCARTCKHHDMLKVGANFVPASQVEQEGQRVDVRRAAEKHGQLHDAVKDATQFWSDTTNQARRVTSIKS